MLSWKERVDIIHGVANALVHLHKNRIIHRDLKPGNILLGAVSGRDLYRREWWEEEGVGGKQGGRESVGGIEGGRVLLPVQCFIMLLISARIDGPKIGSICAHHGSRTKLSAPSSTSFTQ